MKYFRGKFVRATALFMAVIMLVFTPATDYLSVPSGKIESEAAALGGVAIYEVVKYVLIALAGSVGVYGLSKVEWGKLVDEYLWSINDTVLPMATFLTLMAGQKLEGISQWEGSIFYYPNGLGPSDPDDPNPPDPEKKPKISLGRKLAASWTAFLVAKNLTGDSRKPDATEAERTEYIPESVYSDDYVIKLGSKTASEILAETSTTFQNAVKNNSFIYPKFFDKSLCTLYAYKVLNVDVAFVEALLVKYNLLESYPYWFISDSSVYLSSRPLVLSGDYITTDKNENGGFDYFRVYGLRDLFLWDRLPSPSSSSYRFYFKGKGVMSNVSLDLPYSFSDFKFYGLHLNDSAKTTLNNASFYIDLSGKQFKFANDGGTNSVISKLSFCGFDFGSTANVSNVNDILYGELKFNSNPDMAYTYTFPFYASLYDYQQANPSVTAPVPGLYDPTKSTEDVKFDAEGNFSLEFDNLEQSIAQLEQKVDAATAADTALDNQLKQDLMDYIDSLIQGSAEPDPDIPPETEPETKPNPKPEETQPPPETKPDEPTPEDLDPENWKIPLEFKNKFPFSIPWDVYGCLTVLQATETPPVWEVPFVVKTDSIKIEEKVVLDLTKPEYAGMIKIVRAFFLLLYIISLVMVTRYLIKG